MLLDDIATYLAGTTDSMALSTTGTWRIFKIPVPASTSVGDATVQLLETGGRASMRTHGSSLSAPVFDPVRLQVTVRCEPMNTAATSVGFQAGRTLIGNIHDSLDFIGDTTLSGTRYLNIVALDKPFLLGEDDNGRPRFVCNFECQKERG